nr:mitochondrial fission regulator 2-like [Ciona intestinalis]|eukprot:XP_002126739.1 mitochondrial fission regulator 2-like [Ciona intestinalis]
MNEGKENQNTNKMDDVRAGNRRSLVRMIGAHLPLSITPRPRFEILPNGARLIDDDQRKTLFSLSDICQLIDIPDVFGRSQSCEDLKEISKQPDTTIMTSSSMTSLPPDTMETKITALEDELSMLRSQIAMLVSNQTKQQTDLSTSFNSTISCAGEPASSSTPIKAPPPPGIPPPCMPPPPPPPPPPTTPSASKPQLSVAELIRQRKQGKASSTNCEPSQSRGPISMCDVLKDLHKVKLKSVTRSPGGTPTNKKPLTEPNAADPAAFIAAALRKKFAHRKRCDSPSDSPEPRRSKDKEWEDSPPKFGQHLLKKRGQVNDVVS